MNHDALIHWRQKLTAHRLGIAKAIEDNPENRALPHFELLLGFLGELGELLGEEDSPRLILPQ